MSDTIKATIHCEHDYPFWHADKDGNMGACKGAEVIELTDSGWRGATGISYASVPVMGEGRFRLLAHVEWEDGGRNDHQGPHRQTHP